VKKFLMWTAIALLVFYIFSQPTNAANSFQRAFAAVGGAFDSVITFLTALFS
jgi:drug/metabolite transporter superfamily protein YnfA